MGIVCLGGQEVGDRKSGDQIGSEPNASQPKTFGILLKITYFVSVVRVVENSGHRCSEFMGVGQQGGGDFSFPMLRFKHTQKYKRYSTLRE